MSVIPRFCKTLWTLWDTRQCFISPLIMCSLRWTRVREGESVCSDQWGVGICSPQHRGPAQIRGAGWHGEVDQIVWTHHFRTTGPRRKRYFILIYKVVLHPPCKTILTMSICVFCLLLHRNRTITNLTERSGWPGSTSDREALWCSGILVGWFPRQHVSS